MSPRIQCLKIHIQQTSLYFKADRTACPPASPASLRLRFVLMDQWVEGVQPSEIDRIPWDIYDHGFRFGTYLNAGMTWSASNRMEWITRSLGS